MDKLVGINEINEILGESLAEDDRPETVQDDMEALGINYADVRNNIEAIFGCQIGALWLSAFHAGLLVAAKYWDYRVPPGDN